MKRLLSWLTGKRQPRKTECLEGMTLNQILDYNLRAGRLVPQGDPQGLWVGW